MASTYDSTDSFLLASGFTCFTTLNDLFIKGKEQVWMSHGDHVSGLSKGFEAIASSEGAPFAIIANDNNKLYGVQFHPEVYHTTNGLKLLNNFLLISGFSKIFYKKITNYFSF